MKRVQFPYNDVVLVSLNIVNHDICRILVDNLANVLFYDAFSKMDISSDRLDRLDFPIIGFIRDAISVEGVIILPVTVSQEHR